MEKKNLFEIFVKLALVLFFFELVMLFIVEFGSAEFYILIFSMILMLMVVLFGFFKNRREAKNEEK